MIHAAGMIATTIEGMMEQIGVETTMITREMITTPLAGSSLKKRGHSEMITAMVAFHLLVIMAARRLHSHVGSLYR